MEKDIGKLPKNDITDIVIRVDDFGGRPGVTIREFITGDRYTGFTKAGVKISAENFPKFKEMINSIQEEDLKLQQTEPEEQSEQLPPEQETLQEAVEKEEEEIKVEKPGETESEQSQEELNELPDY
jgi:hypothetical protein